MKGKKMVKTLSLMLAGMLLIGACPALAATAAAETGVEERTLRIVDWFDSSMARKKEFNEKFMQNHPGVTIEYTCLTIDQFKNTIMTSLKSGDAPDLFPIPEGIRLEMAVQDNWYKPLTDYVPQALLDTVKPECMMEGYQMLNGVLYALPEDYAVPSPFVFYNKDLFVKAGLDPENPPQTWAEFRAACQKITEAGNGEFYGIIEGGNQLGRLEVTARGWAGVAGGYAGRPNTAMLHNGRPIYETAEMANVLEFFGQLMADGSYHPNTLSISAPEARAMFAEGQAGFLIQGIWCVATWNQNNPELNYGAMPIPRPDEQVKGYVVTDPMGMGLGISANSKVPELAGEYLTEMYGEAYQGTLVADGGFVSIIQGINEQYMPNDVGKEYYDVFISQSRLAPDARLVEPKVSDFYLNVKDVQPGLRDIFQGVLAGSVTDIPGMLKDLSDKALKEWERAAGVAGIDLSVFDFTNWDPTKDYTKEMYQ